MNAGPHGGSFEIISGQKQPWKIGTELAQGIHPLRMPQIVLRQGAAVARDEALLRLPLDREHRAEFLRGTILDGLVIQVEEAGIGGATGKAREYGEALGRASGEKRTVPHGPKNLQPFGPGNQEAKTGERVADLPAPINGGNNRDGSVFDRIQERAKTRRNILQEPAGNVGGRGDDHSVRAKSCCVACLRNLYRELRLSGNDIPGNAFDAHSAAEGVVPRLGKSVDECLVSAAKSDKRVAGGGGSPARPHPPPDHACPLP